jgi:hypothetical protein
MLFSVQLWALDGRSINISDPGDSDDTLDFEFESCVLTVANSPVWLVCPRHTIEME